MGEQSSFKHPDLFTASKKLVLCCYALTQDLPADEKSNLVFYIRNAALTTHLSVSQGLYQKKGKARRKQLQQAKNACVVINAAVDILIELKLVTEEQTTEVVALTSLCFQQTDNLLKEN